MNSKTGVLVSIKIFQLMGGVACMTLHIYAYSAGLRTQHITVFCGTYMGFCLVNVAFLASAIMGKPAAEELDMAFGVIGSCLFYVCGVLGMYFVRQHQIEEQKKTHSFLLPDAYKLDPRTFEITRAQAVISFMTALAFVFDACLKFDMWKYDLDVKKNKLAEDAFDPPALDLFCFSYCDNAYQKWKDEKEQEKDRKTLERESQVIALKKSRPTPDIRIESDRDRKGSPVTLPGSPRQSPPTDPLSPSGSPRPSVPTQTISPPISPPGSPLSSRPSTPRPSRPSSPWPSLPSSSRPSVPSSSRPSLPSSSRPSLPSSSRPSLPSSSRPSLPSSSRTSLPTQSKSPLGSPRPSQRRQPTPPPGLVIPSIHVSPPPEEKEEEEDEDEEEKQIKENILKSLSPD